MLAEAYSSGHITQIRFGTTWPPVTYVLVLLDISDHLISLLKESLAAFSALTAHGLDPIYDAHVDLFRQTWSSCRRSIIADSRSTCDVVLKHLLKPSWSIAYWAAKQSAILKVLSLLSFEICRVNIYFVLKSIVSGGDGLPHWTSAVLEELVFFSASLWCQTLVHSEVKVKRVQDLVGVIQLVLYYIPRFLH